MDPSDERFMRRCLELARCGYGQVNPNPMVGAVIVKHGVTVAEGYHTRFGGDHAEIEALKKAGDKADGATLYVNLEPCNHYGKTPPCTTAIIQSGIRRVVFAAADPNPDVTGNGSNTLKKNGIEITTGVLYGEAIKLNEQFYFSMRSKLPFVILKAATTLDGYIADARSRSKWISGEFARNFVQELRKGIDAVLVGANTIIKDNPRLTVHNRQEKQPYRIILDGTLDTSIRSKVYSDEFRGRTIVICEAKNKTSRKIEQLKMKGVTVISYNSKNDIIPLRRILRDLRQHKINSILVEGGEAVFRQFVQLKLFTKALFFITPKFIGGGVPVIDGINRSLQNALILENVSSKMFGDDVLIEGYSPMYEKYMNEE